uniref:Retrovirus-related Pol polyprotein from transposon TNT 1-94 n=1 Tax=Cajanus cajan TaxID=3821 RepID=A0A151SWU0_CAJCA|nr:Retrovirus-related Pol polyprotein from transposon TNT 1-94 [Cajanus cajan]
MDLFGPSRTMSLGRNYYGLVIVDDYSRLTWVMFLANKSEAFNAFKKFAKLVQNGKNTNITSIRSDHGGEFQNILFQKFFEEHGINHNISAPRTPQQNTGTGTGKTRYIKSGIGTGMYLPAPYPYLYPSPFSFLI